MAVSQYRIFRDRDSKIFAVKLYCNPGPELRHAYNTLRFLGTKKEKSEAIVRAEDFIEDRCGAKTVWAGIVTELYTEVHITEQNITQWAEQKHLDFMIQLSSALNFIHGHHILHNDLRDENILLVEDGASIKIKLKGFEHSRRDARHFQKFVSEAYEKAKRPEEVHGHPFKLHERYGLIMDGPNHRWLDEPIYNVIHNGFPPLKRARDPIFDAPEAIEITVTTAADIWSLGIFNIRWYLPPGELHTMYSRSMEQLSPFHEELEQLEQHQFPGRVFSMLNVDPESRKTASEYCEMLKSSLHKGSASTPKSYAGSVDGEAYDMFSPPPVPFLHNWEEDKFEYIEDEDELKFRFTGHYGEKLVGKPSSATLNEASGVGDANSPTGSFAEELTDVDDPPSVLQSNPTAPSETHNYDQTPGDEVDDDRSLTPEPRPKRSRRT
ncbi:hypothetical protein ABW20_dc0103260 [Dactylellina cionopaga]|nr:hypothetical protein ABW20_dc0103260 [Dactylellina cionopaga]